MTSAKLEMTIRALKENCGKDPLYLKKFPGIMPGDWVMIQMYNGTSKYGEMIKIIPHPIFPNMATGFFEIFFPYENKIINYYSTEIVSYYSLNNHNILMKDIKNAKIIKDMQYVTNLIITKKTNKIICWT